MYYPELSAQVTARCRNFAPLYGIDEEAATGTSNGALTYYLHSQGRISEQDVNTFIQGESMGKPSIIKSKSRIGLINKNSDQNFIEESQQEEQNMSCPCLFAKQIFPG